MFQTETNIYNTNLDSHGIPPTSQIVGYENCDVSFAESMPSQLFDLLSMTYMDFKGNKISRILLLSTIKGRLRQIRIKMVRLFAQGKCGLFTVDLKQLDET